MTGSDPPHNLGSYNKCCSSIPSDVSGNIYAVARLHLAKCVYDEKYIEKGLYHILWQLQAKTAGAPLSHFSQITSTARECEGDEFIRSWCAQCRATSVSAEMWPFTQSFASSFKTKMSSEHCRFYASINFFSPRLICEAAII